jgi:hypothetical protein
MKTFAERLTSSTVQLNVLTVQLYDRHERTIERLRTFVNGQLITRDFATGPTCGAGKSRSRED